MFQWIVLSLLLSIPRVLWSLRILRAAAALQFLPLLLFHLQPSLFPLRQPSLPAVWTIALSAVRPLGWSGSAELVV
ncbi:hypothetical protein D4A39_17235 [Alcanivorax profundi]|uniref:Uncharacterized protein n=1 Tax=Alcanivorax profundi TaxID=2338368 RepID=A0A418XED3_9GAMM|nr:hypothetical protein D4A39_17235 [Alcanivorax profundi]